MTLTKILHQIGWLIAGSVALAVSAWSLYWVGIAWGVIPILAGVLSVCFDGAALVSAENALKVARDQDSNALGPRTLTLLCAGISAYINSYHAVLLHAPQPARLLYAAPPLVAVALFNQHLRIERRGILKRAGKIPPGLPPIGLIWTILFPGRAMKTIHTAGKVHFDRLEGKNAEDYSEPTREETRAIRAFAKEEGIEVGEKGTIARQTVELYRARVIEVGPNRSNGNHG